MRVRVKGALAAGAKRLPGELGQPADPEETDAFEAPEDPDAFAEDRRGSNR